MVLGMIRTEFGVWFGILLIFVCNYNLKWRSVIRQPSIIHYDLLCFPRNTQKEIISLVYPNAKDSQNSFRLYILLQNIQGMGCSYGTEALVFPYKSTKSIPNIKTYNLLKTNLKLTDVVSENVILSADLPSKTQLEFAGETLAQHQLFSSLNHKEMHRIASQMVVAEAARGTIVFEQGDLGNCFFLIQTGLVQVVVDEKPVRTLAKGQTFGELALLFRCPRTASIVCREDCVFLVMKPYLYKGTLQRMKFEEQQRGIATINKVPLFGCLTNKQKFAITHVIKLAVFQPGQVIFEKDDDVQMIYIVSEGLVRISIPHKGDILLREGEIFGEASLADNERRKGSARAVQRTICSIISRRDIQLTMGSFINNLVFYNLKRQALMRSSVFNCLATTEIHRTIIQFKPVFVKDGTVLDGRMYKGLVICLQGSINNQEQGIIFNQSHWINRTYACDQMVKNGDGYCSFLSFKRMKELFEEFDSHASMLILKDKLHERLTLNCHQLNLNHFTFIRKIGEGQFGKVLLVKNNQYGNNLYALKVISKQVICREGLEPSVINERAILEQTIFPYIVGFVKAFQDEINLYILMEYIHGKDLFDVIRQAKKVTPDMARYYMGCLILAVQYLHLHNIVYRDLKPENSVVDWNGKLMLVDLGTAVMLEPQKFYKTFTIIGTPHYMAPQIYEGNGYSFQVDVWSLGCILYEFLCYSLPYGQKVEDPYIIYSQIKQKTLKFPSFMKDKDAKELINCLLIKDPRERGRLTFEKIKRSAFFKGFNWRKLLYEEIAPPYIPKQLENWKIDDVLRLEGKRLFKYLYSSDYQANLKDWNEQIL